MKRRIAARTAFVLAIAAAVLTGSCNNNLTWWLQTWGGLDMLEVQGGTMTLGDVENWPGDIDEYPLHDVTLSTFEMSRFEVTQSLYEFIMGTNPSQYQLANGFSDEPCRPVEMVSWQEAVEFCNELSLRTGLDPCYTIDGARTTVTWNPAANGYRLPTEAEWEYAARGGTISEGFTFAGADDTTLADIAWYDDTTLGAGPHCVGELGSNELGFYDMSGNVAEWCWDYQSPDYDYTNDWTDPRGLADTVAPINGIGVYIVRGGAHEMPAYYLRNAKRLSAGDTTIGYDVGFRVARNW